RKAPVDLLAEHTTRPLELADLASATGHQRIVDATIHGRQRIDEDGLERSDALCRILLAPRQRGEIRIRDLHARRGAGHRLLHARPARDLGDANRLGGGVADLALERRATDRDERMKIAVEDLTQDAAAAIGALDGWPRQ